jgi:dihydroxy-acid dehydratase
MIELDVEARKLHLEVSEQELARRREVWQPPEPTMRGGYQSLYVERVLQADRGADLDFLVGSRGHAIPRESH